MVQATGVKSSSTAKQKALTAKFNANSKAPTAQVKSINAARNANVDAGRPAYEGTAAAKGQLGNTSGTPSLDTTKQKNPLSGAPVAPDSKNPNGINTATPTGTAPTPPAGTDGMLPYEQAQKNLNSGGLSGNALASANTALANRYGKAHADLVASGAPPSSDPGTGAMTVADATKPYTTPDTSAVDTILTGNPGIDKLLGGLMESLQPQKQTTNVMDYAKLYKNSGLDKINAEMIDAETVINGTEDDLRNEIQGAGGLATDSQVQALALSRNKSLLVRYNQLAQMKTDATNQLNTMMNLNAQDKQMAQTQLNTRINGMFQLANFAQQAQNNIKEQARWSAQYLGADGLYNSLKGDPKKLAYVEQTVLGLAPGGMASAAATAAKDRAMEAKIKQAQYNKLVAPEGDSAPTVKSINGQDMQWNPSTKTWDSIGGNSGADVVQSSRTKDKIDTINTLTKNIKATGPNELSRWDPLSGFTGAQQKFIGSVEQLRSELTLGSLIEAKARGATFGALSEGEMRILDATASKIGTWAVKDQKTGQIKGYNIDDASMKQELDKINQYAKLDYLKKGGSPTDVGVQQMSDGHYYTQNSDGSYTELY